jgi:hypothetical protein
MTREELIELAALDAFGLLDEYEAALYTRSFHHAPVAVQDEITQIQSEFASDETFLPDVKPSPELREQVLRAVARAIESESARFAPLATIGRGGARSAGARERRPRLMFNNLFWRAATFALAGTLLVMAYFGFQINNRVQQLTELLQNWETQRSVQDLAGPQISDFVGNPNCDTIALASTDGSSDAHAVLYIKEGSGESCLLSFDLPEDVEPFSIIARTETGEIAVSHDFNRDSAIGGTYFNAIAVAALNNVIWEVVDITGACLLRSA